MVGRRVDFDGDVAVEAKVVFDGLEFVPSDAVFPVAVAVNVGAVDGQADDAVVFDELLDEEMAGAPDTVAPFGGEVIRCRVPCSGGIEVKALPYFRFSARMRETACLEGFISVFRVRCISRRRVQTSVARTRRG
jgi:hypothetical protein